MVSTDLATTPPNGTAPVVGAPSALVQWVSDARAVQSVAEHIAASTFVPQGLRGKPVEDDARKITLGLSPGCSARCHQIRLRAQNCAVLDDLEAVGGKGRTGRGDVDDHLGGAGRGRAFGRAGAFDNAIVIIIVLGIVWWVWRHLKLRAKG